MEQLGPLLRCPDHAEDATKNSRLSEGT
jgi:hypothetical protein